MSITHLTKLSTLLVVESIEPCLPAWQTLGYAVQLRVPEQGPAVFAILAGPSAELMLQTRASLAEDLPAVAARQPTHLLYADVASVSEAAAALSDATVLVPRRKTPYGATEIWVELASGIILGLAEHAE